MTLVAVVKIYFGTFQQFTSYEVLPMLHTDTEQENDQKGVGSHSSFLCLPFQHNILQDNIAKNK